MPAVLAAGGGGQASANAGGGKYCAADAQGAVGIRNAEMWGDVVKKAALQPGDKGQEAASAEACCSACADTRAVLGGSRSADLSAACAAVGIGRALHPCGALIGARGGA